MCDVYLHTGVMYPGGQAVNVAVYAKELGAQADYMGVFGRDAVADHIQATLDAKGVGRSHCRSYPGENGFARVTLVDGDRVFQGSNRGGVLQDHPIFFNDADLAYVAGFDLVHTTNNGFTDGLLPALHPLPCLVSYDFSYRWTEEDRIDRVCPNVDFAFLSCSDLDDQATQALCRRLCDKGCGVVTATRGSKGATVFDGVRFYTQTPQLVQPVDTMGAGDSFAAAMLVSILKALECQDKGLWSSELFRAGAIPAALSCAASFSAQTCLIQGAFGCGTPVPESLQTRMYGAL